jgi:hypothetical protein
MATSQAVASPVEDKSQLQGRLKEHSGRIRSCGVKRLEVFGSFQRGEATPESDVDLLVELEPGQKTYDRFLDLSFLLEEILGRPIELLTRESLSPYIGPRILEEAEDVALGA